MDTRNGITSENTDIKINYDILSFQTQEDRTYALRLSLQYASSTEHTDLINRIFQNHGNYCTGLLSARAKQMKFSMNDNNYPRSINRCDHTTETENNTEILTIEFYLTHTDTDFLLETLSMLNDALNVLKRNGVYVTFTIMDVIDTLSNAITTLNESNSNTAIQLNQIKKIATNHPQLTPGDVILLQYCFSALTLPKPSSNTFANTPETLTTDLVKFIDSEFINIQMQSTDDARTSQPIKSKVLENELVEFITRLNLCQRIKLFEPCLGKQADDGGHYTWHYTEWHFLRDAKFTLDKLGKMHIEVSKDTNPNSGYSSYYKTQPTHHEVFEKELRALAPFIDVKFNDDIKYHETISFTPTCSKKLFEMGLHLDVALLKMVLLARNHHRFFEQALKTGALQENLLPEVIKSIFTLAYGRLLDGDSLDKPMAIGNAFN